jgi:hypothetical protein
MVIPNGDPSGVVPEGVSQHTVSQKSQTESLHPPSPSPAAMAGNSGSRPDQDWAVKSVMLGLHRYIRVTKRSRVEKGDLSCLIPISPSPRPQGGHVSGHRSQPPPGTAPEEGTLRRINRTVSRYRGSLPALIVRRSGRGRASFTVTAPART